MSGLQRSNRAPRHSGVCRLTVLCAPNQISPSKSVIEWKGIHVEAILESLWIVTLLLWWNSLPGTSCRPERNANHFSDRGAYGRRDPRFRAIAAHTTASAPSWCRRAEIISWMKFWRWPGFGESLPASGWRPAFWDDFSGRGSSDWLWPCGLQPFELERPAVPLSFSC
jgi:hypothetical protein